MTALVFQAPRWRTWYAHPELPIAYQVLSDGSLERRVIDGQVRNIRRTAGRAYANELLEKAQRFEVEGRKALEREWRAYL